jgi:hypothetical protein
MLSDRLVFHTNYEGGESDFPLDMFVLDGISPEGATFHSFRVKVDPIQFTTILDGVLAVPTGMHRSGYL